MLEHRGTQMTSQAYLILIHDKRANRIEPVGINALSAEEAIMLVFEDLTAQGRQDDMVIGAFTAQDVSLMKQIIDGVQKRSPSFEAHTDEH